MPEVLALEQKFKEQATLADDGVQLQRPTRPSAVGRMREKQAAGPTVEEDLAPLLSAALTMGKVCCDAFVVEPKSKRARGEEERKTNKTNVSERASKHRSQ